MGRLYRGPRPAEKIPPHLHDFPDETYAGADIMVGDFWVCCCGEKFVLAKAALKSDRVMLELVWNNAS